MGNQPLTFCCPRCGEKLPKHARYCEYCGIAIKQPIHKKWWFWVIVVILAFWLIPTGNSDGNDTQSKEASSNVSNSSNKPANKTEKTIEYTAELSNGYYTSGIDFPAGKYDITAIEGKGNVSSDNMFNGGINAMMGVGDSEYYELEYQNIDLSEGVVLKISNGLTISIHSDKASAKALSSRNQPNTETISLSNGYFVAGEDFPEGVYDVLATSGHGNVSSDNMFDGGINEIMGAEESEHYTKLFKNVTFTKGTTLKIDGVDIDLIPSK